jgi:hypothetical protein
MMKAYKKQGGGRRNGSILITYLLGALLIALAPVLSIYAHSKHRGFSTVLDPLIFVFLGVVCLWWVYSPDSAWKRGFLTPDSLPDPITDKEGYAEAIYRIRYAPDLRRVNFFRWPFFKYRNWGLGNETIVMTVTVVTAAVAIATLLNEFDKVDTTVGGRAVQVTPERSIGCALPSTATPPPSSATVSTRGNATRGSLVCVSSALHQGERPASEVIA